MWWSLTFKRLARNEPPNPVEVKLLNYTSISSNIEFLRSSRLKKFLFIADAVQVFWLLSFAFLGGLNHYLHAESLKFCMQE